MTSGKLELVFETHISPAESNVIDCGTVIPAPLLTAEIVTNAAGLPDV